MKKSEQTPIKERRKFDPAFKREAINNWVAWQEMFDFGAAATPGVWIWSTPLHCADQRVPNHRHRDPAGIALERVQCRHAGPWPNPQHYAGRQSLAVNFSTGAYP